MVGRWIALLAAAAGLSGCILPYRPYRGAVPHKAAERDVSLEAADVVAGHQTVIVHVNFDIPAGATVTAPRLAAASSTGCGDGLVPRNYSVNHRADTEAGRDMGSVVAEFTSSIVRGEGLLEREPASMVIEVIDGGERPVRTCHRVPVVSDPGRLEWQDDKAAFAGIALRLAVPTTTALSKMGAAVLPDLQMGLYLGPLRLSGDLFLGSGFGGPTAPENSQNSYGIWGGGLALDTLIVHASGFGVGLLAGGEAMSLVFDPAPTVTYPHRSYALVGPRGALRFVWFGPELPGRAFHAHPQAITTSISLDGSLLHDADAGWVPMVGVSLALDVAF